MRFVFDFGGVLFRWRPRELLKRELPAHAVDEDSAARLVGAIFQGYGGDWGEFDRGRVEPAPLAERIARRTGLTVAEARRVIDGVPAELAPIDATVSLLARLRAAGQRLHYLSNMPGPYADHLERSHGFVGWFESGVFSARVGLAKPDRDIFDHAQALFGAAPDELLFLDDHPDNVQAARAAGWRALQFSDAARCEAELRVQGWWPAAAG
jgi:putative hydrolase of the HAD superfamily